MQKEEKMLETVMPHNREAEMAVLGSMILNREATGDVSLILKREDFYGDAHQEIFSHLLSLYETSSAYDLLILKEHLERASLLDRIGGTEYLVSLAEFVPSAANAEHYARIVRDKGVQRKLIQTATSIVQETRSNHEDMGGFLDEC